MKSNNSLVIRTVHLYHIGTDDLHDCLENFLKMLQYHINIWFHDYTLSIKCYSSRSGIAWTIPSACSFNTLVDKAKKLLFPVSSSMYGMWKQAIRKGWRKAEACGCMGIIAIYKQRTTMQERCVNTCWPVNPLHALVWINRCLWFCFSRQWKIRLHGSIAAPGHRGHNIAMFKNKITFIINIL